MQKIALFLTNYLHNISQLPQLWHTDQQTFWGVCGSLLLIILLLVLLITGASRSGRNKKAQGKRTSYTVFVPVEASGVELDTMFLPLSDRIADCNPQLSEDVIERIKRHSPDSLADIVSAYDRCCPQVREQLEVLVRSQKMMEAYSRKLIDDKYPQGVLIDAWRYFPDKEVLRSFVELLASHDERMQMVGVRLLSSLRDPKCLSLLVLALVQPEKYLPARVAEVFLSMPHQSAELLAYMLPEIDDLHKEVVLEIIAQTGVSYTPDNVVACLKHKNYHIRAAAALALGSGHIQEALPALIMAAGDKRWQVRAAVAKSLGMLGDNRAVSILEGLRQDKEGWVANNAEEALALFRNI